MIGGPNAELRQGSNVVDYGQSYCEARPAGCPDLQERVVMIQHVMLFWFKDGASEDDVRAVLDGIASFTDIPAVDTVAVSENRGDPQRAAPFTHAAILGFRGLEERDAFFADERHVSVRQRVIPLLGELKTISVES